MRQDFYEWDIAEIYRPSMDCGNGVVGEYNNNAKYYQVSNSGKTYFLAHRNGRSKG